MKNDEILHKWVNGELSPEELEAFKLRPEYESLMDLYKNTDKLTAPDFDEAAVLKEILKLEKTPVEKTEQGRRGFLNTWMKYAAAASVLLLAVWFFWPKGGTTNLQMAKGERTEGTLPDASTFVLNAESSLSYDAKSWSENRSLELNGEAFFEVKKGTQFKVNTPLGAVQVLGTQFNVFSRKGLLEVKCTSGKVAVLSTEGKVLDELIKGEALRVEANKVVEKYAIVENSNWMNGVSRFRKVSVKVVLDELSRQFNIEIDASAIDTEEIISCNFQHRDLDMALKTCLVSLGVKHESRKGKVRLYR